MDANYSETQMLKPNLVSSTRAHLIVRDENIPSFLNSINVFAGFINDLIGD